MYRIRSENFNRLQSHNIRISQLNPSFTMSTPRKVVHLPRVRLVSRGRPAPGGGLRITNVTSIRPPDPETAGKQEEEKLRQQLQKEIVSRSRSCGYSRYSCPLPVAAGRAYCPKHILSDPTAPYAQCKHERCTMPARLAQDPDQQLCFEHARAALHARHRAAAPPPPVATTETLLNQLQHYVKPERVRTTSCASSVSVVSDPAAEQEVLPHAVDPFKQIDATTVNQTYSTAIMECASASDSDADSITISGNEPAGDTSDPEDAPAEETPLWRAGVYTAEEAALCALGTLRALQAAYSAQCARLHHALRAARARYLRTLKQQREQYCKYVYTAEEAALCALGTLRALRAARARYLRTLKQQREQYCSINSQALSGPLTVKERRQLRKLKAYASYRRRHGVHAVLARKLHHKRAKAGDGSAARPIPSGARCSFAEGGVRCAQASLPAARHCLKHVAHDAQQVLFVPCGDMRGGVPCREPRARLPLPAAACRYHTDPPPYAVFTLKKDDSESDSGSDTSVDSQVTHCEDELPAIDCAEAAA